MDGNGRLAIGFRVGWFPCLTETFVVSQIEAIEARGHRVSVLADGPAPAVQGTAHAASAANVRYVEPREPRLKALYDRAPYRVRRAWTGHAERRWCAEQDVVLCHFAWSGASVAESVRGWRGRPPMAVVFHGDDLSRTLKANGPAFYERVVEECDLFLPVSRLWASRLEDLGAPHDRIAVHRMGIDVDRFAMRPGRTQVPRPFRLVSVGRLVPKKGTAVTLKALARLRAEDPALAVTLDVLGDGPLRAELEALAGALGLADVVTFHGAQPADVVHRMLAGADGFVLPSETAPDGDMEGVPVAIMEAMASGVPVVSTRHSGIPELVEDGRTGLLSEEGDVEGLARSLKTLVEDPERAACMAAAARETIEAEYHGGKLADRLVDVLTDLARRAPAKARASPDGAPIGEFAGGQPTRRSGSETRRDTPSSAAKS